MLKWNVLCLLTVLSLFCVACDPGLTSEDVLIDDIAYAEMFNKVMLNVINNYYDGQGTNYSKSDGTGVWLGDWQGDSGTYAPDILFYLANDPRLLSARTAEDRQYIADNLKQMAERTLDYSLYALNEFDQYINGGIFPPSRGEMSGALGGFIGLCAGYERTSDVSLKETYYGITLQFTELANAFLNGDPELEPLGDLLANLYYSPIMVGGMCAYNMSRFAVENEGTSTFEQDVELVGQTLTTLDTRFWNESTNRFEYDSNYAGYYFDHPAATLGNVKYYQLTENPDDLNRAIELGEFSHGETDIQALSHCTNTAMSFLALYEVTHDSKYLEWVAELLDAVQERFLVEDPYHPEYLIAAHDLGRASRIDSWPEYVEGQPCSDYPACTGCNNQLCLVIYLYDKYLRDR